MKIAVTIQGVQPIEVNTTEIKAAPKKTFNRLFFLSLESVNNKAHKIADSKSVEITTFHATLLSGNLKGIEIVKPI